MQRLGVISDTHDDFSGTRRALRLFRDHGVSVVIHCGDIGGVRIVRLFEGMDTHFVFGNMDGENDSLRRAAAETGNTLHGWFGSLERAGKKIFFLHGHHNHRFQEALRSEAWDLICYGHTHCASVEMYGKTMLLNPGAFQRVSMPQVAVVSLPELSVESFAVPASFD